MSKISEITTEWGSTSNSNYMVTGDKWLILILKSVMLTVQNEH